MRVTADLERMGWGLSQESVKMASRIIIFAIKSLKYWFELNHLKNLHHEYEQIFHQAITNPNQYSVGLLEGNMSVSELVKKAEAHDSKIDIKMVSDQLFVFKKSDRDKIEELFYTIVHDEELNKYTLDQYGNAIGTAGDILYYRNSYGDYIDENGEIHLNEDYILYDRNGNPVVKNGANEYMDYSIRMQSLNIDRSNYAGQIANLNEDRNLVLDNGSIIPVRNTNGCYIFNGIEVQSSAYKELAHARKTDYTWIRDDYGNFVNLSGTVHYYRNEYGDYLDTNGTFIPNPLYPETNLSDRENGLRHEAIDAQLDSNVYTYDAVTNSFVATYELTPALDVTESAEQTVIINNDSLGNHFEKIDGQIQFVQSPMVYTLGTFQANIDGVYKNDITGETINIVTPQGDYIANGIPVDKNGNPITDESRKNAVEQMALLASSDKTKYVRDQYGNLININSNSFDVLVMRDKNGGYHDPITGKYTYWNFDEIDKVIEEVDIDKDTINESEETINQAPSRDEYSLEDDTTTERIIDENLDNDIQKESNNDQEISEEKSDESIIITKKEKTKKKKKKHTKSDTEYIDSSNEYNNETPSETIPVSQENISTDDTTTQSSQEYTTNEYQTQEYTSNEYKETDYEQNTSVVDVSESNVSEPEHNITETTEDNYTQSENISEDNTIPEWKESSSVPISYGDNNVVTQEKIQEESGDTTQSEIKQETSEVVTQSSDKYSESQQTESPTTQIYTENTKTNESTHETPTSPTGTTSTPENTTTDYSEEKYNNQPEKPISEYLNEQNVEFIDTTKNINENTDTGHNPSSTSSQPVNTSQSYSSPLPEKDADISFQGTGVNEPTKVSDTIINDTVVPSDNIKNTNDTQGFYNAATDLKNVTPTIGGNPQEETEQKPVSHFFSQAGSNSSSSNTYKTSESNQNADDTLGVSFKTPKELEAQKQTFNLDETLSGKVQDSRANKGENIGTYNFKSAKNDIKAGEGGGIKEGNEKSHKQSMRMLNNYMEHSSKTSPSHNSESDGTSNFGGYSSDSNKPFNPNTSQHSFGQHNDINTSSNPFSSSSTFKTDKNESSKPFDYKSYSTDSGSSHSNTHIEKVASMRDIGTINSYASKPGSADQIAFSFANMHKQMYNSAMQEGNTQRDNYLEHAKRNTQYVTSFAALSMRNGYKDIVDSSRANLLSKIEGGNTDGLMSYFEKNGAKFNIKSLHEEGGMDSFINKNLQMMRETKMIKTYQGNTVLSRKLFKKGKINDKELNKTIDLLVKAKNLSRAEAEKVARELTAIAPTIVNHSNAQNNFTNTGQTFTNNAWHLIMRLDDSGTLKTINVPIEFVRKGYGAYRGLVNLHHEFNKRMEAAMKQRLDFVTNRMNYLSKQGFQNDRQYAKLERQYKTYSGKYEAYKTQNKKFQAKLEAKKQRLNNLKEARRKRFQARSDKLKKISNKIKSPFTKVSDKIKQKAKNTIKPVTKTIKNHLPNSIKKPLRFVRKKTLKVKVLGKSVKKTTSVALKQLYDKFVTFINNLKAAIMKLLIQFLIYYAIFVLTLVIIGLIFILCMAAIMFFVGGDMSHEGSDEEQYLDLDYSTELANRKEQAGYPKMTDNSISWRDTMKHNKSNTIVGRVYNALRSDELYWAEELGRTCTSVPESITDYYYDDIRTPKVDDTDLGSSTDWKTYVNRDTGHHDLGKDTTEEVTYNNPASKNVTNRCHRYGVTGPGSNGILVGQTESIAGSTSGSNNYTMQAGEGIKGPKECFNGMNSDTYSNDIGTFQLVKSIKVLEGSSTEFRGRPQEGYTTNAKMLTAMANAYLEQTTELLLEDEETGGGLLSFISQLFYSVQQIFRAMMNFICPPEDSRPIIHRLYDLTLAKDEYTMLAFAAPLNIASHIDNYYLSQYIFPTKFTAEQYGGNFKSQESKGGIMITGHPPGDSGDTGNGSHYVKENPYTHTTNPDADSKFTKFHIMDATAGHSGQVSQEENAEAEEKGSKNARVGSGKEGGSDTKLSDDIAREGLVTITKSDLPAMYQTSDPLMVCVGNKGYGCMSAPIFSFKMKYDKVGYKQFTLYCNNKNVSADVSPWSDDESNKRGYPLYNPNNPASNNYLSSSCVSLFGPNGISGGGMDIDTFKKCWSAYNAGNITSTPYHDESDSHGANEPICKTIFGNSGSYSNGRYNNFYNTNTLKKSFNGNVYFNNTSELAYFEVEKRHYKYNANTGHYDYDYTDYEYKCYKHTCDGHHLGFWCGGHVKLKIRGLIYGMSKHQTTMDLTMNPSKEYQSGSQESRKLINEGNPKVREYEGTDIVSGKPINYTDYDKDGLPIYYDEGGNIVRVGAGSETVYIQDVDSSRKGYLSEAVINADTQPSSKVSCVRYANDLFDIDAFCRRIPTMFDNDPSARPNHRSELSSDVSASSTQTGPTFKSFSSVERIMGELTDTAIADRIFYWRGWTADNMQAASSALQDDWTQQYGLLDTTDTITGHGPYGASGANNISMNQKQYIINELMNRFEYEIIEWNGGGYRSLASYKDYDDFKSGMGGKATPAGTQHDKYVAAFAAGKYGELGEADGLKDNGKLYNLMLEKVLLENEKAIEAGNQAPYNIDNSLVLMWQYRINHVTSALNCVGRLNYSQKKHSNVGVTPNLNNGALTIDTYGHGAILSNALYSNQSQSLVEALAGIKFYDNFIPGMLSDCSGFVSNIWYDRQWASGTNILTTSGFDALSISRPFNEKEALPGDILISSRGAPSHALIYIGRFSQRGLLDAGYRTMRDAGMEYSEKYVSPRATSESDLNNFKEAVYFKNASDFSNFAGSAIFTVDCSTSSYGAGTDGSIVSGNVRFKEWTGANVTSYIGACSLINPMRAAARVGSSTNHVAPDTYSTIHN